MRVNARSAAVFATVFAAAGLLAGGPAAAVDPDTYSPTIAVTVGTNEQSQVPVTLHLPAPGDGIRIAQVTFSWSQVAPTASGNSYIERLTVPTPDCVAEQPCQVQTTLPSSRMINGSSRSVWLLVSDGTQILGSRTFYVTVNNPKPSSVFTEPSTNNSTAWGSVTLAADAAPGANGAALKGVRFYPTSTGRESDPYIFDDTAPYAVQVPATDIARPGGQGRMYAIAEDVEGNLTPVTYIDLTQPMVRTIRIGPPPQVGFWTPVVDGIPAGGTSSPALLGWDAEVPDIVPDGAFGEPYIARVQVLIDGVQWLNMPYDKVTWYNNSAKPRQISFSQFWDPADGVTAGPHVAQLRVTTSYGSVGVTERSFVVTDGVVFGPLRDGGRTVRNGYVVTAGTEHLFAVVASGKVADSALQYWNMSDRFGSYVEGLNGCTLTQWWECPDQVAIRSRWAAPTQPGRYTLTWEAQASGAEEPTAMTRTVVVQARGAMAARTRAGTVPAGRRTVVTGRFTRTDTGRGVPGVKARLRWRRAGADTWKTLTTDTTDRYGRLRARPLRRHTGRYRWVTAGIPGTVSGARSAPVTVTVAR